ILADVRRIGLDEVVRHFEELEDPRSSVRRKHPLVSVVVIALMAVLAGAGGPTAIARWAALKTQNKRDKGGGDRRGLAVGCGAMSDAAEEVPSLSLQDLSVMVASLGALASLGFRRDNDHYSKLSVARKDADLRRPGFFQDLGGFPSFSRSADPDGLQITLVQG